MWRQVQRRGKEALLQTHKENECRWELGREQKQEEKTADTREQKGTAAS
jgi:hypothetical protein